MTDETRPEEPAAAPAPEPSALEAAVTETAVADRPVKLTQQVEFKDIGPCKKHIKVSVERGDIDKRLDEEYSKLVVDAPVSGFRPGKAPPGRAPILT